MANGEDLVYDWLFNVVDEPTEWAFNWNYAEGGTSAPVARKNHATLWLTMNVENPVNAVKVFFQMNAKKHPIRLETEDPSGTDRRGHDDDGAYAFTVIHKRNKKVFFRGIMRPAPDSPPDPNVGTFVLFKSTTKEGTDLMKKLVEESAIHGMSAVIPHERIETDLNVDGYKVVSVTGEGPEAEAGALEGADPVLDLATRFTLLHNDEEVARCHMTYRDVTYDPSTGPTIEMIAVKQSRRGEGLAMVLWHWVRRFIEENFTLECLNNDAPLKHVMIKATQIGINEVDVRVVSKEDNTGHPLGFKQLLYDYCGFSVREQKSISAFMFRSRRPKDEEAVLFIPLLTKEELKARKSGANAPNAPKPGKAYLRAKKGARMCHWCSCVSKEVKQCMRCGVAFYCNASCQKKDWKKRHKKWCGKTREEVRQTLIQEGDMLRDEDGSYSLVMKPPGGFGNIY